MVEVEEGGLGAFEQNMLTAQHRLAYHAGTKQLLPTALAIAAASLLYVAVADLIPSLHRRPEPLETVRQFALIALGVGVIAVSHALLEH